MAEDGEQYSWRRRRRSPGDGVCCSHVLVAMVLCCVALSQCAAAGGEPLVRSCTTLETPSATQQSTISKLNHLQFIKQCGNKVDKRCQKGPEIRDVQEIDPFSASCLYMPTIPTLGRKRCEPPGPPQSLNASILHATKDGIAIIVDWKMPDKKCPLTGYRVAIRKLGSSMRRDRPCICFNVSMLKQVFMLSSDSSQYGCASECLTLDTVYGMRTPLEIEITSLPIPKEGIYRQSAYKTVYLPSCQELEPRPDYCRSFPPAPPRINVTTLNNGSVHIQWAEPRHDDTINITGYTIYRQQVDHSPLAQRNVDASARGYMTESMELDFDTEYKFWVMAKSTSTRSYYGDGLSDFSNVVTATINSIDGAWSDWSAWSECPYCDGSLRVRYRNCTSPTPKFDGLPCEGPVEDRMLCNHTAFCMASTHIPRTFVLFPSKTEEAEENAKETTVPFYHKNAFFITLCVTLACITFFIGGLACIYRKYSPTHHGVVGCKPTKISKLSTSGKEVTKSNRFDMDNVSLPDAALRPQYPYRLPSVSTGESGYFDSPLPQRSSAETKTVYISYSRKQEGRQMDRIFEFCEWLMTQGFDVVFDRWDENSLAEDIAGWIQRNIENSHYIISICSESYAQAWLKVGSVGTAQSKEDLTSLLSDDLEGYQMKRLYLETMLINIQLMRNACRNTNCIPVLLLDSQNERSTMPRIPSALSNSRVYHLTDISCDEANELLYRLHGIELWQKPMNDMFRRREDGRKQSESTDAVCNFSVGSGTSTITTTYAESNYSDVVTDSCSEDTASR